MSRPSVPAQSSSVLRWIEQCERAAVEAYRRALAGLPRNAIVRGALDLALEQHGRANALARARLFDGTADDEPASPRGTCALWADVVGVGELRPMLSTLRECEARWTEEYRDLLDDPSLGAETHALLLASLLPPQRAHVAILDRLIAAS